MRQRSVYSARFHLLSVFALFLCALQLLPTPLSTPAHDGRAGGVAADRPRAAGLMQVRRSSREQDHWSVGRRAQLDAHDG